MKEVCSLPLQVRTLRLRVINHLLKITPFVQVENWDLNPGLDSNASLFHFLVRAVGGQPDLRETESPSSLSRTIGDGAPCPGCHALEFDFQLAP